MQNTYSDWGQHLLIDCFAISGSSMYTIKSSRLRFFYNAMSLQNQSECDEENLNGVRYFWPLDNHTYR